MTKKVYSVFTLQESVSGFSNEGIEYNSHSFNLAKYHKSFHSEQECEKYIEETLKDYKSRKVDDKKTRFVILPVFSFDDDLIF
jgi:hypothetical protein